MPAWSLSISLGSNKDGQTRKESYEKAAAKTGDSLSEWAKTVLDAAAGIKYAKEG